GPDGPGPPRVLCYTIRLPDSGTAARVRHRLGGTTPERTRSTSGPPGPAAADASLWKAGSRPGHPEKGPRLVVAVSRAGPPQNEPSCRFAAPHPMKMGGRPVILDAVWSWVRGRRCLWCDQPGNEPGPD